MSSDECQGTRGFPHDTRPSTLVSFRISRFGFRILLEVHIDPRIGLRSNIQFFQFLTKFGTETRKYAMIHQYVEMNCFPIHRVRLTGDWLFEFESFGFGFRYSDFGF